MGGSCSTCNPEENKEEVNMDGAECDDDSAEKFNTIINDYKAKNEKLRNELETLESRDDEVKEKEEQTRQNEEVMRELGEIKALLDVRSRVLVRGRLEAALLSKATSMLSMESTTKLCFQGELKYRYGKSKKKNMYVEVHVSAGEVLGNHFKAGHVMLTYSETKDSETSNRCQVLEVIMDKSNDKEYTFTISASVGGELKEVAFSCENAVHRDVWVKALIAALAEVKSSYDQMHETFTLKIEFSKEKLGISVEERSEDGGDEKSVESDVDKNGRVKQMIKEIDANKTIQKTPKNLNNAMVKASKLKEEPCELLVTRVVDEDLITAGLKKNYIVRAINDQSLSGMVYSEQLKLLQHTPKPYFLTFTGKKLLNHHHQPQAKHGYQSIMKELVADGDNSVKSAFYELVNGTPFENELKASKNQQATIEALLADQRKFIVLLRNFTVQSVEL